MASGDNEKNNGKLTRQLLKSLSNEFDPESIHTISLSRQDLNDISAISECIGLERLDLSYNDLTRLHPLSALTQLQVLDLSANRLTALDGLNGLDKLEKLNLAGNLLGSVASLRPIISLETLRHLRLNDRLTDMSNPICMRSSYKEEVVQALPKLVSLDGEILRGQDSDVFKLLADIEAQVGNSSSPRSGPTKTTPPPPKVPEDLFTINWSNDNPSSVVEHQFKSGITECQALSDRGSQLIKEAEAKLKKLEKV